MLLLKFKRLFIRHRWLHRLAVRSLALSPTLDAWLRAALHRREYVSDQSIVSADTLPDEAKPIYDRLLQRYQRQWQ